MAITELADPLAAIVQYLLEQEDLMEFCGGHIYGGELPKTTIDTLTKEPKPAVIVQYAGTNRIEEDSIKTLWPRLQIRIVGPTHKDIAVVYGEVYRLLHSKNNLVQDGTRLMSIILGGLFTYRDPDVNLPSGIVFASVISQRELC